MTTTAPSPSKGLHIGLWVVQVLLAVAFGMAGMMKLSTAPADLVAQGMAWAGRVPAALVPFIGAVEALAAVGLILPSALRILPWLTPLAASGLVVVMVLAAGEHGMNGEAPMIGINVALGGLAAFVAWGRHKKAPIAAK